MYSNLKLEMWEKSVSVDMIAELLKKHRNTVANKIKGKVKFNVDELQAIRNYFFPDCTLDYLCEKSR